MTPNGRTPSASTGSWSLYPTVTTRWGAAGIRVVPLRCSTLSGKPPVPDAGDAPVALSMAPPQAVTSPSAPSAPAPVSSLRRVMRSRTGSRSVAGTGPPGQIIRVARRVLP
ncbi:hypothetical protein [Pseudonocardia xinjiangensis]|uniref:hypothetical protein n=1 Tax=Pseudonocardia xinjiangensis TaxID=75289 RepID=UPI0031DFE7AD